MGVLPLQFKAGEDAASLGLTGAERFNIRIGDDLAPAQALEVEVRDGGGESRNFIVQSRIDTPAELEYYRNGGILQTVLRRMLRGD